MRGAALCFLHAPLRCIRKVTTDGYVSTVAGDASVSGGLACPGQPDIHPNGCLVVPDGPTGRVLALDLGLAPRKRAVPAIQVRRHALQRAAADRLTFAL